MFPFFTPPANATPADPENPGEETPETAVGAWVRFLLQKSLEELPDTHPAFLLYGPIALAELTLLYPCAFPTQAQTQEDQALIYAALGLKTALLLRPILLLGANAGRGILKSETMGPAREEWGIPTGMGPATPPEVQWAALWPLAMAQVSCVHAQEEAQKSALRQAAASSSFFAQPARRCSPCDSLRRF